MVVGEYGLVSNCLIPFLRQIRSNSTSAGRGLPNRPVNTFPLSVKSSSGMPYGRIAATNARHTARPVARRTTVAITQNREWSSRPEISFSSVPSARNTDPVTSSCHSCIGASRCQRL